MPTDDEERYYCAQCFTLLPDHLDEFACEACGHDCLDALNVVQLDAAVKAVELQAQAWSDAMQQRDDV